MISGSLLKNFLSGLIILLVLTSIPFAFGQINLGQPALVKDVMVTIKENGEVNVVHEIKGSSKTVSFSAVKGELSNLKVNDVDGNEVQHGTMGGDPLGIMLFPSQNDVLNYYILMGLE